MRYKDFVFESNPKLVCVNSSRNIREVSLIDSGSAVENISRNAAVISGEGAFYGEKANEHAAALEALQHSSDSGWLFLPDGGCYNAYFKELSVKKDAGKNCVFYSFSFVENCSRRKEEYDFEETYAQEGENMFDIAFRCKTAVETLMKLNNYKNPFAVSAGDRVVLK